MLNNLDLNNVWKITQSCDLPKVLPKVLALFIVQNAKESPKELNVIAKMRGIKCYISISEDEVLSALNLSKINFSKARIEKIRKEFNESRHKFSKSKINDIRRHLCEVEDEKNLFAAKIKEIRRNLLELEENLFKSKKYYNYDDIEYRGIRNLKDLFDLPI